MYGVYPLPHNKGDAVMNIALTNCGHAWMKCAALLLAIGFGLLSARAAWWEEEPPISRVLKLTHVAVILPEETIREDWNCEAWTPTVEQVTAAEKTLVSYLRQPAKGSEVHDRGERYIIQYFGVVMEKKKWIVCSVYK